MLNKNWRIEYKEPEQVAYHLINELLAKAYKQGSVKRVKACAEFLIKHNECTEEALLMLAEAGQKSSDSLAEEVAITELHNRSPQQVDYAIRLVQLYYSRGAFSEALYVLTNTSELKEHSEYSSYFSKLNDSLSYKNELLSIVNSLFSNAPTYSQNNELFIQAEHCLELAKSINDLELCISILTQLVGRQWVDNNWLFREVTALALHCEDYQYVAVSGALKLGENWGEYIEKYMEWCLVNRKPVGSYQGLLNLIENERHGKSVKAKLCLLAIQQKWHQCSKLLEKYEPKFWPEYCFKYVIQSAQKASKKQRVAELVDSLNYNSYIGYWSAAAGLEGEPDLRGKRIELLSKALELEPDSSVLLNDLGDACFLEGNFKKSKDFFYRAYLKDQQGDFFNCYNLALALKNLGDNQQSFDYFKVALSLEPEKWIVWKSIADFMSESSALPLAQAAYRLFLSHGDHKDSAAWIKLGQVYQQSGSVKSAIDCFDMAESLTNEPDKLNVPRASLYTFFGHADKARKIYSELLENEALGGWDEKSTLTNLLFNANYDDSLSSEQLYHNYLNVERIYPRQEFYEWHAVEGHKKIKIGYVSADFKRHACAYFLLPLLSNHDHSQFEVHGFSGVQIEDDLTEEIRGMCDQWHYVARTNDNDLIALIRKLEIDILVDVSGHTGGHRLSVFARKPAPIQVSWLGFGYTTGLPQIDYFLSDYEIAPIGSEHLFSEKPLRLDRTFLSFTPTPQARAFSSIWPAEPPKRPLILGSATRAIRINSRLLKVWAEIMRRIPDSEFRLDNPSFMDPYAADKMRERLIAAGLPANRIWVGRKPSYFAAIADMDICLDCFPHNSGTTVFDMLWAGTPVVTMRDRPSVGRIGVSIIHGLGMDDWIADTEEEYVDIVVKMASDRESLLNIKKGLRKRLEQSELMDGKDFCQHVEAAFVKVIKEYNS